MHIRVEACFNIIMSNFRLPTYIVYWIALGILLLVTDPRQLPVWVLIVPFGLIGLAVYKTWQSLPLVISKGRWRQVSGGVVAFTVVVCVGLQSLGELTLRDILIVVLFASIAYFYLARLRA